MYCTNCGKQIEDTTIQCPYCNAVVTEEQKATQICNEDNVWRTISCCFPSIGLILYVIWKIKKPALAKKIKDSALIGMGALFTAPMILCFLYSFILIVAIIVLIITAVFDLL